MGCSRLFWVALVRSKLFWLITAYYTSFCFYKLRIYKMLKLPNLLKMNFMFDFITIWGKRYYKVGQLYCRIKRGRLYYKVEQV